MWPILLKFNLFNLYFFISLFFSMFLLSLPLALFNSQYLWFYSTILLIYFLTMIIEVVRLSSNLSEFIKILFIYCRTMSYLMGVLFDQIHLIVMAILAYVRITFKQALASLKFILFRWRDYCFS